MYAYIEVITSTPEATIVSEYSLQRINPVFVCNNNTMSRMPNSKKTVTIRSKKGECVGRGERRGEILEKKLKEERLKRRSYIL